MAQGTLTLRGLIRSSKSPDAAEALQELNNLIDRLQDADRAASEALEERDQREEQLGDIGSYFNLEWTNAYDMPTEIMGHIGGLQAEVARLKKGSITDD